MLGVYPLYWGRWPDWVGFVRCRRSAHIGRLIQPRLELCRSLAPAPGEEPPRGTPLADRVQAPFGSWAARGQLEGHLGARAPARETGATPASPRAEHSACTREEGAPRWARVQAPRCAAALQHSRNHPGLAACRRRLIDCSPGASLAPAAGQYPAAAPPGPLLPEGRTIGPAPPGGRCRTRSSYTPARHCAWS